uniref:Proline/serine-rich coiled-coil protein 1 n=1 Tax=Malurus cyaneus samueli TaxID=2593467 RepID=A0A8C5T3K6_9PASS
MPRGDGRGPRYGSASAACSPCFPPGVGGPGLTPSVPSDVRFVTEESFDFGVLSPSDSQEEEEDEESPGGGCQRGGSNGRWSPLRGARLEEMVREATRLAAQLEGCHLPPPAPGDTLGTAATPPGTPRSPRRQTFVVKDSPVRALLPTVESQAPAPTPRPPAKPRGPSATTSGPSGGRGLPPSRVGPPRPCPPQGQGAGARGRSEPPRGGTAGTDGEGTGTPWRWGLLDSAPTHPSLPRPPFPCTHHSPQGVPSDPSSSGVVVAQGMLPPLCLSFPIVSLLLAGAGAARVPPPTAASGCKPGPPPARLRPPRKTAVSSTPR